MLFNQFNCYALSRKECAKTLGVSTSTLDRWRTQPILYGPKPKVNNHGSRTVVLYSISEVADFLARK